MQKRTLTSVTATVCAGAGAGARERRTRIGYLQVDAPHAAARAVYRRLGLAGAYAYHYRALTSADG